MQKKVKILAVGIGGFANNYLSQLIPYNGNGFEIVGAVEPFPETCLCLDEFKKRNIPIYSTMQNFYENHRADLAIICTPIYLHTEQTLIALNNASNVMCEKPLSPISSDAEVIENLAKKQGKFVITGYQWSFSDAMLALKKDFIDGALGKPIMLKTLIFYPRDINYFNRGSVWAGKIKTADGKIVNDSVASNAAAHYLHNIFFVTGKNARSSEAINIKADLLRVNNIENFDTAVISFGLDCGGKGLFIASHSTLKNINPIFEYKFENATVKYNYEQGDVIAYFNDGRIKNYGCPSTEEHTKKIYEAINACTINNYKPVCSPYTAVSHIKCIESVQKEKIFNVCPNSIKKNGQLLYVEGLDDVLLTCYEKEIMPRDKNLFGEFI